ncbi:GIY-YIG nuclease family protein [Brevundimonas sp. TWP1-2-1b1]|uniref:GIY-YIG nuclease family protein n=1 Tax=unclassified Brevundimonas TaxID=2622653 RepID=UPI003CECCC5B
MTQPDSQALYVMQNEFGLIKIGRSLNPELRRKNLQSNERCAIAIVAVLEKQGHLEEAIHLSLMDHAIEGEWFDGTAAARAAVIRAIPTLGACDWPFEHCANGAAEWLDELYERRDQRSVEKLYRRILQVHLQQSKPGPDADGAICHLISIIETGQTASLMYERLKGEKVVYVCHPGSRDRQLAPRYTTNLALALALRPDDIRPAVWEGAAYDCAIAAMAARHHQLR